MDMQEKEIFQIISIAFFLLIVCVVLFLVVALKHQKKISRMNAARVAAEIELLEAERNRLAAELHDELGPSMALIKTSLECVESPGEANDIYLK